jgi:hypothetical protein
MQSGDAARAEALIRRKSFGQTIERVRTGPSTPKVEPAWQPRDPPYDIAKVMGMIREEFNRAGDDFPFLLRPY